MIFVVTVRIMKIVDGRKEIFMKEKIVKRMEQELNEYREYLVSGKLTAQKILEEAYQLVIKQELYYIFENHNCSRLSEEELNWMNQQNNMLDYLYDLWMHNDTDLAEEFAEIIHTEIIYDMEEHMNE